MKKLILIALFSCLYSFSQEVKIIKDYKLNYELPDKKIEKNVWYLLTDNVFFMEFSISPIGIKNIMEKTKSLLVKFSLDFEKPKFDNSYISSLVKDLNDYEMLDITIDSENSEITKAWSNESVSVILTLKKGKYNLILKDETK